MKRFWLLALLTAGTLAMTLVSPVSAKMSSDDSASDSSMEDINSALGSMAIQLNDMDSKLKDSVSFYGDVRARYVFEFQSASATGVTISDASFARFRARLGAKITHGDFTAKFRIATGSVTGPWSQNDTWGASGAFADPAMQIDTAQIDWKPSFADGMLLFTVGKMGNPLTKTAITWDPDIQPEGVFGEFKKDNFSLKATYFELGNQITSAIPAQGKIDLFMDNFQAEYDAKIDDSTGIDLMVGYEYIPNSTLINTNGLGVGAAKNNVLDPHGVYRDWNNVEGMLSLKTKVGDVPLKIYVHATDNLNGLNLPDAHQASGHSKTFTNQYAWLAGLDIGKSGVGSFGGQIFYAQTDPNSQLGFLVDDDSGRTNSSYLAGTLATELEKHVTLKLSEWANGHEYYSFLGSPAALGGNSQNPEFVSYLDCIVDL